MNKNIIAFDIGGTKIRGIVWDETLSVSNSHAKRGGKKTAAELKLLTPKTLAEFKTTLKEMVLYLAQTGKTQKVGIAVAGIVDRKKGAVVYSPNLRIIDGFNFTSFFKKLGFASVKVENDANCFALAEVRLGQGRGLKNFVGLTLGTGLGGGLISRGELYTGTHGSAGEPGHMMADEKFTYEQKFQILKARNDWKNLGRVLGRLVADIINLLDVEAVVVGGSIARKFGSKIIPAAKVEAKRHLLNKAITPKILVSKLKHAGAVGAVFLF